jgi:hypothetical protein
MRKSDPSSSQKDGTMPRQACGSRKKDEVEKLRDWKVGMTERMTHGVQRLKTLILNCLRPFFPQAKRS